MGFITLSADPAEDIPADGSSSASITAHTERQLRESGCEWDHGYDEGFVSLPLCDSQLTHFFVNLSRQGVFCDVEIIIHLETKPERRRIPEIGGQSQGCVRGDASLAMNDFVYPARGNSEVPPDLVLTDVHRLEKLLIQDFSRMYCRYFFHFLTLMVANYFNIVCVSFFPFETDSPSLIDANAVLPFSFSR